MVLCRPPAVENRSIPVADCQDDPGRTHPSDQGSQYTDGQDQQLLREHGIEVSMNGVGS